MSFDKSATFWVLLYPLSHNNIQMVNAKPMRGYCCKIRLKRVDFLSAFLSVVVELQREGVQLYGGPRATALFNIVETKPFHLRYSSLALTIEIVDDIFAIIDYMHHHGSSRIYCIVTKDNEVAETFIHEVDNVLVFDNVSTRFCDGGHFELVVFLLETGYKNSLVYVLLSKGNAKSNLGKEVNLDSGKSVLIDDYNSLALKLCESLYASYHLLTKRYLLIFQHLKLMGVLHRKMIERGSVHVPTVLLKWKILPPKHGT